MNRADNSQECFHQLVFDETTLHNFTSGSSESLTYKIIDRKSTARLLRNQRTNFQDVSIYKLLQS